MRINENQLQWKEKYRPQVLEDYIGSGDTIKSIKTQLDDNQIQDLLLYGPPGTGKSSLAKIIVNTLDCTSIYINASDENGINTIRNKVKGFAATNSFRPIKIIILDEADYLTVEAQMSLRNVIEEYSHSTRFILTCNYIERIAEPLISRCNPLPINAPKKTEIAIRLSKILENENISFEDEDLAELINKFYPDIRKMINSLQNFSFNGVLKISRNSLIESSYRDKIIKELSKDNPSWHACRKIILSSNVNDFYGLYKHLYEQSSKYAPGMEGKISVLINESLYQLNFKLDREINLASTLNNIIELKTK